MESAPRSTVAPAFAGLTGSIAPTAHVSLLRAAYARARIFEATNLTMRAAGVLGLHVMYASSLNAVAAGMSTTPKART